MTEFLHVFISAVLMCEQYVVHNTVSDRGMSVHSLSVYSLWVIGFLFLCVEKNNML